jgi:uncharacterized membrane protein
MSVTSSPRIANIGPAERRKRLIAGIVGLTVGVLLATALITLRAPAMWRMLLFFPFLFGALGVFQSRDKT